jgi:hypothetical protein
MQTDGASISRTTSVVTFGRPFRLGLASEIYPAGRYQVESEEAVYEGLERTVKVRTSVVLVIPTASGTVDRVVDAGELQEALRLDAEQNGDGC